MFMCYELVHYCLKLLAPNLTDRSNSARFVEPKDARKRRGGDEVVVTESDKRRGKRKATSTAAATETGDTLIGSDADDETPVKKVLESIHVTY